MVSVMVMMRLEKEGAVMQEGGVPSLLPSLFRSHDSYSDLPTTLPFKMTLQKKKKKSHPSRVERWKTSKVSNLQRGKKKKNLSSQATGYPKSCKMTCSAFMLFISYTRTPILPLSVDTENKPTFAMFGGPKFRNGVLTQSFQGRFWAVMTPA